MPHKFNENLRHKIKKARCQVFKLALHQTEGLMTSIARVMGAAISIPDFSCIASTRFKSCHPTPQGGSSVFDR